MHDISISIFLFLYVCTFFIIIIISLKHGLRDLVVSAYIFGFPLVRFP
jgi:hypothetical protein